nr:F-box only protein 21-like [Onthophagus taurus]
MLDNLPLEVLQIIIEQKSLDIRDLINLSSTCSYLRRIILSNNILWKNRYLEKWSKIDKSEEIGNYYEEICHLYVIRQKVDETLTSFATNFMNKEHLSDADFKPFLELINSRNTNRYYIEDYLWIILNDHSKINTYDVVPLKTRGNLTFKYYSLISLRYLRHIYLEKAWKAFNLLKEEDQLLEIGATMLTQWCRPECDIKIKKIRNQFDKIAEEVKEYLKINSPNHPLIQTNQEDLNLWRDKIIYKNQFSSADCKVILDVMQKVICQRMDFCGNQDDYFNINNSFITEVLESKRGLPITLSILYEGVARRLGVNLEPVNTPSHFLLRFIQHDTLNGEMYYVDVYNRGLMSFAGNSNYDVNPITRASTKIVIERMVNNLQVALRERLQPPDNGVQLMRSILELNHILHPYDLGVTLSLTHYYMKFGIDTTPLKEILQTRNYLNRDLANDILDLLSINEYASKNRNSLPHFLNECNGRNRIQSYRHPDVKFAIGMVMRHKLFNYTCVIYGWDHICAESDAWKREMNVDQLQFGARQPFYQVLVEDGTKRYAAQENLIFSGVKNGLDKNPEVGRFFTHFFRDQYVPNCVKNEEYPNDVEVRMKFHLEVS